MKSNKIKGIVILIGLLIVIALAITLICIFNKDGKFYLSDKYYNEGKLIDVDSLDGLEKDTYLLFVYNDFCTFSIPCEDIFREYAKNNNIDIVSMSFRYFKNTSYYNNVQFGPSVVIIKKGKVIDYLKADSDEDYNKYQDVNEFTNWVNNYINVNKK